MPSAGGTGFWQSVRELPGRTPLRVKLITAVLALVAVALAVISITTISVLRGFLLQPYDATLESSASLGYADQAVGQYLGGNAPRFTAGACVAWVPSGGKLQWVVYPAKAGYGLNPYSGPSSQPPTVPVPQVSATSAWLAANSGRPLTVPAQSGDGRWRVLVQPVSFPATNGPITGTVVIAVDVSSVYHTVSQVTGLDLLVSGLLLFCIAIAGFAVVRASLRPLTDIEQTAAAIAAGDLSSRVPERDPGTEVGRLGRSLNTMLSQIETAFGARTRSEEAARQSEERMRRFVADASHELRTPLTAIRGFAEYYRQRGGLSQGPAQRNGTGASAPGHADTVEPAEKPLARAELDRIMQRVEQESSRMGVLVEDMLLLARLDQQRPMDRRPVDLLTLAADAVHDARLVAPDRSVGLTVGAGAAPIVLGDEARLRQVIGNLMSNAISHTPAGTPIEVRVRSGTLDEWRGGRAPQGPEGTERAAVPARAGGAAERGGRVVHAVAAPDVHDTPAAIVEVADQGPGLTPDQAEHAFERFYRADQARRRTSGGAGLGLAIVAALVTAHGGAVWVESPPGGGAIFRFAIPLTPEAQQTAPEPGDGQEPGFLDSRRGLVAGVRADTGDAAGSQPPRWLPPPPPAPGPARPRA